MSFNGVLFPVAVPRITMPFKATETKWYSDEKPHKGVDIAPYPGSEGAPVRMPLHGSIVHVNEHDYAGLEIITRHEAPYRFGATALNGDVVTFEKGEHFHMRMTHHSKVFVSPGQMISAGDIIAFVGSTGAYTTGPHVHLELHKGDRYPGVVLDPIDFFIAAIPGLRDSIVRPW